jgi:hypothetical protein
MNQVQGERLYPPRKKLAAEIDDIAEGFVDGRVRATTNSISRLYNAHSDSSAHQLPGTSEARKARANDAHIHTFSIFDRERVFNGDPYCWSGRHLEVFPGVESAGIGC